MKKHCLLLGKAGLIYNSWLLDILFIAFIIAYEGNQRVSWPGIIVGFAFALLLLYSFLTCFIQKGDERSKIRLPYVRQAQAIKSTQLLLTVSIFHVYRAKLADRKQLTYLTIVKKRSNHQ